MAWLGNCLSQTACGTWLHITEDLLSEIVVMHLEQAAQGGGVVLSLLGLKKTIDSHTEGCVPEQSQI